jgi:hypothetical protein
MVQGAYLSVLGFVGCFLCAVAGHAEHRGQLHGLRADVGQAIGLPELPLAALAGSGQSAESDSAGQGRRQSIMDVKAAVTELFPRANQPADAQAPARIGPTAEPTGEPQSPTGEPQSPVAEPVSRAPAEWTVHDDYLQAMKEAAEDRKLLLIYFHERTPNAAQKAFETETLANLEIQEKLRRYVFLKLPRDARITVGGKSIVLLEHPAFAEMLRRQGVAIIDLVHQRADYYGHVVSAFGFTPGKYYRKDALSIILDLPPGSLTQRTMIYAVRIHPERPASTQGQLHATLAEEAQRHAHYQASIQVQGHHSWDSRFHRINAKLPGGAVAQEVVAESWPNENLVEACIDCVHSWRQSPGHWGAVQSRQPLFGYDIKRGRNGIWYATGIFGRR